jgi:hypothetical protein
MHNILALPPCQEIGGRTKATCVHDILIQIIKTWMSADDSTKNINIVNITQEIEREL